MPLYFRQLPMSLGTSETIIINISIFSCDKILCSLCLFLFCFVFQKNCKCRNAILVPQVTYWSPGFVFSTPQMYKLFRGSEGFPETCFSPKPIGRCPPSCTLNPSEHSTVFSICTILGIFVLSQEYFWVIIRDIVGVELER